MPRWLVVMELDGCGGGPVEELGWVSGRACSRCGCDGGGVAGQPAVGLGLESAHRTESAAVERRSLMPFDDFNTSPLPADVEQYQWYRRKSMEFVSGLDGRIRRVTVGEVGGLA